MVALARIDYRTEKPRVATSAGRNGKPPRLRLDAPGLGPLKPSLLERDLLPVFPQSFCCSSTVSASSIGTGQSQGQLHAIGYSPTFVVLTTRVFESQTSRLQQDLQLYVQLRGDKDTVDCVV